MSGHTPGPWEFEPNGMGAHIVFMGEQVTKRFTLPFFENYKESEANARLIAAAPDLLEAAKEVIPFLYAPVAPDMVNKRLRLQAAINRAEEAT